MALFPMPGDLHVEGNLSSKTFTPPSGSIGNSGIAALAGISASKLQHRFRVGLRQLHGTAATAERRVIHVVRGATAEIKSMRTGPVVIASGDRTVTIDLYKNGSSILSATYVIDSGNAAYSLEGPIGYSSVALVQGDVLEEVRTLGGSTGNYPQGVFTEIEIDEDAV